MILPLFRRSILSVAAVLAAICVFLIFYIASIVYLYDPSVSESLQQMQDAMPELFAAFDMANPTSTLCDFLLNYLYGFLFTGALVIIAAYLASRLIVGPAKDGSLAWILASPHTRLAQALSYVVVEIVAVVGVVAILWISESALCEWLFPGELVEGDLAIANIGLIALALFAASLCFASGSIFKNSGAALWVGTGLCVLFMLMTLVSSAGDSLNWVADLSPFSLYDAYGLANGESSAIAGSCTLFGLSVMFYAVGVWIFCRRDFSL